MWASFRIEHSSVCPAKKIHIRKSIRATPYHTRAFVRPSLSSFFFSFLLFVLLIHDATSRVCYNSRTALIILLFSNESVDADGSTPAHKMHGTGCVSSSSLLLSFSSFLAVSLKSLLPGSLARERGREHVPRV